MKAIVKATGKIVELADGCYLNDKDYQHSYYAEELEGVENSLDYWTRLEHQYAGMAMQTMLATLYNPRYHKELMECYTEVEAEEVARLSKYYAHALVEKMKEERK